MLLLRRLSEKVLGIEWRRPTLPDKGIRQGLLIQHFEIHCRPIPDLVIHILKTSPQKHMHTLHDLRVVDADPEFGERRDGSSPNDSVFQNDSIVNVSNVFGWVGGFWSFQTEEVQDPNGEFGELAVFNELAQVSKGYNRVNRVPRLARQLTSFTAVIDVFDHVENRLDDSMLEIVSSFVPQYSR